MSAERPVLVIHGVANHDKAAFEQRVTEFNRRVNQGSDRSWTFTPVFWGDLGAAENGIEDTIPSPPLLSLFVRDDSETEDAAAISPSAAEMLNALFVPGSDGPEGAPSAISGYEPVRSNEARRDAVAEAAADRTAEQVGFRGDEAADDVAEAIRSSWNDVIYLKFIDHPRVLAAIGRAVADSVVRDAVPLRLETDDDTEQSGAFAVRDDDGDPATSDLATRAQPLKVVGRFVGGVMHGVDRAVGAVLGEVLGSVQDFLRKQVSHGVAGFLGDVLVYQRNQERIQERLWSYISDGWGTSDDRAVDVVAHSLGGVIAFDAATTAARRLHVRHLVTFGSQSSFFQVIDPRQGLTTYIPATSGNAARTVSLPSRIQSWLSLWEPLDPLAFLVGSVFRLSSHAAPTDERVPHAPTQLWTHSTYWTSDFVANAVRETISQ